MIRPALLVALWSAAAAAQEPRALSLADAVELAIAVEPTVAEARIAVDRGKLGVLRAQLDRVSLKIDGQIQELWNKVNIGGAKQYQCMVGGLTTGVDPTTCASLGGVSSPASDSSFQGLTNVAAQLNVPLFSGFRVSANVKRAELQKEAAIVQIRQARKDTALAVAHAYWGVRRLQLQRDAQAAALGRLRDSEAVVNGRVRAGLAPPIDANRARVRRLTQEAVIADLEGQAQETIAQFTVALAVPTQVVLIDPPSFPDAAPPQVERLLAEARGQRPELRTAQLQAGVQHELVRIAQSNFYPQLTGFGLLQFGNNPFIPGLGSRSASSAANPFSSMTGNLTLGGQLTMNFFDTLNTYTGQRDAKYEEARLIEEERRFARVVESDVRVAHAKLGHLYAQREPLTLAREVARDNLSILEARYKNGDALVIELLDSQVELAKLEAQLADLTAQLQIGWIELDASLGRVVGSR